MARNGRICLQVFQQRLFNCPARSIQTRSYTDRAGNNRTAFEVVADKVFFTGEKQREPEVSANASAEGDADFEEIVGDDELPF